MTNPALPALEPPTAPAARPDSHDELLRLRRQLVEKESMVAALTTRLERAAEQLDRIKRTGSDRVWKVNSGIPQEFVQTQHEMSRDIKHILDCLQTQQHDRMEQLCDELSALRNALRARPEAPETGADSPSTESSDEAPAEESLPGTCTQESTGARDEPMPEERVEEPADVTPPTAIDLTESDVETLQDGITKRDAYIAFLLQKLRYVQQGAQHTPDWAQLSHAPDELVSALQQLERELTDRLALAEVELSVERARLAREIARLKRNEQLIQRHRTLEAEEADRGTPVANGDPGRGRHRWLRFLGLTSDCESGEDSSTTGPETPMEMGGKSSPDASQRSGEHRQDDTVTALDDTHLAHSAPPMPNTAPEPGPS